jgi:hypothetical protein
MKLEKALRAQQHMPHAATYPDISAPAQSPCTCISHNSGTSHQPATIQQGRVHKDAKNQRELQFETILVMCVCVCVVCRYQDHHGVRITDAALAAAATLSDAYLPDRQLPDKAIDLIDEAAAKVRSTLAALSLPLFDESCGSQLGAILHVPYSQQCIRVLTAHLDVLRSAALSYALTHPVVVFAGQDGSGAEA